MKITAFALTALSLLLLFSDKAAADRMGWAIMGASRYAIAADYKNNYALLYPGQYTIRIFLGNENLGCSLRVGTKSSNPNLMKLSGPLAVFNITDASYMDIMKDIDEALWEPLKWIEWKFPFKCGTKGTITVSQPPTVTVPMMMTLTYGPFLTKTVPVLVTQKVGIKSVSFSPVSRTYSLGQPVTMNVNFTRKAFEKEDRSFYVNLRVKQGKLCFGSYSSIEASNEWRDIGSGELDGQLFTLSATLCELGQTIVEFKLEESARFDSTSKRLVFNVYKRAPPTRKTSQIRSRGIETLPLPVIPDPEPPALPNFELQGKKP